MGLVLHKRADEEEPEEQSRSAVGPDDEGPPAAVAFGRPMPCAAVHPEQRHQTVCQGTPATTLEFACMFQSGETGLIRPVCVPGSMWTEGDPVLGT